MDIPSTASGVVVLLVLVMPGIVYAAARSRWHGRGVEDREVGARVLRAMMVSAALDAIYAVLLGPHVYRLFRGHDRSRHKISAAVHSRELGLLALVGIFVVPLILAGIVYGYRFDWDSRITRWVASTSPVAASRTAVRRLGKRVRRKKPAQHPTPSSWDWIVEQVGGCFVRVRLSDDRWVGGWLGSEGFASTYPEPRDLYIEKQWHLGSDGTFLTPVAGGLGLFVALTGGEVVDWLLSPSQAAATAERSDVTSE